MAVGINGCIGKPMIREGRDIHVYVRRSLRDVFRKVPTFVLEVKVVVLSVTFLFMVSYCFMCNIIFFRSYAIILFFL